MDTKEMKDEAINVEFKINKKTFEPEEEKEVFKDKEYEYKGLQLILEFITFMFAICALSQLVNTILERTL